MNKWILSSLLAVTVSSNLYAADIGHFSKQKIKINNQPAYKITSMPAVIAANPMKTISQNKFMPTQIFDIQGTTDGFYDCEQLLDYIESLGFRDFYQNKIASDYVLSCPVENNLHFSLKGYLEPMDDRGTVYARQMIEKLEGLALFNTVFHFEPANAVIYNFILELGTYQNNYQNFHQHQIRTISLNFKSQREALPVVWQEIISNLEPDEPSKILPLMDKYFFIPEDFGQALLKESNLVKLHRGFLLVYGDKSSKMIVNPDLSEGFLNVILKPRHTEENLS